MALLLVALIVAPAVYGETSLESDAGGSFERYSFTNGAGTRTYKLYVPPTREGGARPLVVELHGCTSNADEEARWSRFNTIAEAQELFVVYPEQSPEANGSLCWNWFHPDHQSRDGGEPSLIAGITREVMERWDVDPRRVYVGGISAGGAMADIMAATYPDLYAAAMVYAGCEYRGTTCTAAVAVVPPALSGRWAYEAAREHARVVPVIVFQGSLYLLSPFPNAELVVQQFLAADDWADDGADDGSISRTPARAFSGRESGRHKWAVDQYEDAAGCLVAERWLVHGLGHAWSMGDSNGSLRDAIFTDPLGPDLTTRAWEFFRSHPMPPSGVACFETD